ncbi:MAG TPA: HlyD family efflux transporter periplasmic adaptor subunit [Opitutaceae bacterium]|nr:HlyD family efflux transporter periplasmic adaptor subunit [Opitutaceae bacterium]
MKNSFPAKSHCVRPVLAVALLLALAGCGRHNPPAWQGYLEGEFVYVAAPLSGQLETLSVQKGAQVATGAPLFTLEHSAELAAQQQAAARLADLRKGQRPTELAALEAHVRQAQATAELSSRELARQETLFADKTSTADELDRARLTHEANLRAADQLAAELETARLGSRPDVIDAAQAALAQADWSVAQKSQAAPCSGLVFDTLYRAGEFVAAGNPVVALLPPENLKVRFFVPEPDFAALRAGGIVHVSVAGHTSPLDAGISYLSPQPEYTPPVLYNRDNRAKLVFMVEAVFSAADARGLHPGQPVDVSP